MHPYQYASAQPVLNTDPTGWTTAVAPRKPLPPGQFDWWNRDRPCVDHVELTLIDSDGVPHCYPYVPLQFVFVPEPLVPLDPAPHTPRLIIDPLGNIICADDGDESPSPGGALPQAMPPMPPVPPDAPDALRRAVENWQRELYRRNRQLGLRLAPRLPEVATVARNRVTGEIFQAASGQEYPLTEVRLRRVFGKPPMEEYLPYRPYSVCAEAKACYFEAKGHGLAEFDIFTWEVRTGQPRQRCPNCQVSVNVPCMRIFSDPPYPSK